MCVAMESSGAGAGVTVFGGGSGGGASSASADGTVEMSAPPAVPRGPPTSRQQREAQREARLKEKSGVLSTANYLKALAAGKLAQAND